MLIMALLILLCSIFHLSSAFRFNFVGKVGRWSVDPATTSFKASSGTRLSALPLRPKAKRRQTWEEKYEVDSLKSDSPTVDVHPPIDRFTKWFACYAPVISPTQRSQAWVHHMQWARRTVLSQGLRDLSVASESNDYLAYPVKIDEDYTLLSDDRMRFQGQLVVMRANSSEHVVQYLQKEPLHSNGGVGAWKAFEIKLEQHNHPADADVEDIELLADCLTSDLHDPYLLLSFGTSASTTKLKATASTTSRSATTSARSDVLDRSLSYHLTAAQMQSDQNGHGGVSGSGGSGSSEQYLPLYANASRVVMLGRLKSIESSSAGTGTASTTGGGNGEDGEVVGQLLLFNARSRADALRYLKRDPVASSASQTSAGSAPFDAMTLAAVNVQDVSGLHHVMARSYGVKAELDQFHFMDPEDLLLKDERDGLASLPSLPDHFEENRRLIAALEKHRVSYRYTRMSDENPFRTRTSLAVEGAAAGDETDHASPEPAVRTRGRPGRKRSSVVANEEDGADVGVEGLAEEEDGEIGGDGVDEELGGEDGIARSRGRTTRGRDEPICTAVSEKVFIDSLAEYSARAWKSLSSAPSLRGFENWKPHVLQRGILRRDHSSVVENGEMNTESISLANAYSSGWYYGMVNSAQSCDSDDWGGDNNPISMEAYALNVCIFEGGQHIKYQCDGESIVQEVYNNANCTSYNAYFPVESVGCRDNIIYNCSADNTTFPIPAGQSFVTQLYYETSHDVNRPNCTGQVQYFVGEANEHCFPTQDGSEFNVYPNVRVYSSHDCSGDFFTNADVATCTVDAAFSAGGDISYTHFNTSLLAGPPNHPPSNDDNGGNDDFFDDEAALIGVCVGGGVALLLAAGVGYYMMTKPGEGLLAGGASSA